MIDNFWTPGLTLDEIERQAILQALRFYRGNKTQTAIALGISSKTVDNKLERYENERRAYEERQVIERAERLKIQNRLRGIVDDGPLPQNARPAFSANAGIHVESIAQAPPQPTVPMHERREVQTVLPKQAPARGHHRGR